AGRRRSGVVTAAGDKDKKHREESERAHDGLLSATRRRIPRGEGGRSSGTLILHPEARRFACFAGGSYRPATAPGGSAECSSFPSTMVATTRAWRRSAAEAAFRSRSQMVKSAR